MELNKKGTKDMNEQAITQISIGRMRNSRGDHYGFNYYFEAELEPNTGVVVAIPEVTPNKRSVNDIGWMITNQNAKIYGTLSPNPENDVEKALWQEVYPNNDINKVVSGIMVKNFDTERSCRVLIRVIMC